MTKRYGLVLGLLLIMVLALAPPGTAATCGDPVILSSGDSIANAVSGVCDGGTIILGPGTYEAHGITIGKDLKIRAADGSTAADIIIDGMQEGNSIFTLSSGSRVALDNLTLQNGTGTNGGAISAGGSGSVTTVTSCIFTGFTATGHGGAIYNNGGTLSVTASAFSGCTAPRMSMNGGAIYSGGGSAATITSSSFTGCNAGYSGGAIYSDNSGGSLYLDRSTFSHCSGMGGGAVYSETASTVITGSSFSDCTAAAAYGGAVCLWYCGGDNRISNTTFFNCSSYKGGAILDADSTSVTVTSSTFSNCSATIGGAIYSEFGHFTTHFSRIVGCNNGWDGYAVRSHYSTFDAGYNWWGSNTDPSDKVFNYRGTMTTSPWLVLGAAADLSSLTTAQTSGIRYNLTYDSDGYYHAPAGGHLPDGIPGSWAIVTGTGAISPGTGTTLGGANTTMFTPAAAVMTNISATVDDQTVYLEMPVTQYVPPLAPTAPVPTLDTSGNDDGFPTVTPTATQAGALPPMTVTVNIGGDSKAWQAVVTGTKLQDLIVTGTVQHNAGDNVTAPPGRVFQYISLVPARFATISHSTISFTVPQSWLDENHIDPKSIVLYHLTANGWKALPTTVLSTKDGTVYFSAESTGFSLFAIAGTPAATPAVTTVVTSGSIVQEMETTRATATKAPVTMQTTAPPATTPQPAAPSPLLNIVLVIAAIGVLAGGGFMARRWWIRRQNPALFQEYD